MPIGTHNVTGLGSVYEPKLTVPNKLSRLDLIGTSVIDLFIDSQSQLKILVLEEKNLTDSVLHKIATNCLELEVLTLRGKNSFSVSNFYLYLIK